MRKINVNELAVHFRTSDFLENTITLNQYKGKRLLLSFFRDASCPFCNLRVRELIINYPELQKRNIHILAFFASTKDKILKHAGKQQTPFPLIPDPSLFVYKSYGVEESFIAKLKTMGKPNKVMKAVKSEFFNLRTFNEKNIVPADFMIDENQKVMKAHYGKYFGDHIPLVELLNW